MNRLIVHQPPPADDALEDIGVAAIVHAGYGVADALLADFARGLRRRGWRVGGLVQQCSADDCADRVLVDLGDGTAYPLSQNLGGGSVSCCIDTQGVAAASVVLRRALDEGVDLAIANRFGGLESGGGGFAAEMLALMSAGVPLLTVVAEEHLAGWRHFTGGCGSELPASLPALEDWFARVVGTRDPR